MHLSRTLATPFLFRPDMTAAHSHHRSNAKSQVLEGLARLRTEFPLEQRVREASLDTRKAYARLLDRWLSALPPIGSDIDTILLERLIQMDAVVPEEHGLGCYPFSSRDTSIHVILSGGTVSAMCAFDALAIARLARTRTRIQSLCVACATRITIQNEENGGLDHDQVEVARVVWMSAEPTPSASSQGLCRHIRFLCPNCAVPVAGDVYTLPQAAAIANAFFRFQPTLLTVLNGETGDGHE